MFVFAIVTLPSANAACTSSLDLSKYGVTDDFQVTVLTCQSGEYPELALLLGPVGSGAEGITLPCLKFVTV